MQKLQGKDAIDYAVQHGYKYLNYGLSGRIEVARYWSREEEDGLYQIDRIWLDVVGTVVVSGRFLRVERQDLEWACGCRASLALQSLRQGLSSNVCAHDALGLIGALYGLLRSSLLPSNAEGVSFVSGESKFLIVEEEFNSLSAALENYMRGQRERTNENDGEKESND